MAQDSREIRGLNRIPGEQARDAGQPGPEQKPVGPTARRRPIENRTDARAAERLPRGFTPQNPETLRKMGHSHCDYIVSGLPFFVIEPRTKDRLLQSIAKAMDSDSRFITYQVTTQLCDHDHLFELAGKEYCPLNFPPINVLEFRKAAA